MSAGSAFDARSDTLGIQTGTFDFAQIQLEEGELATKFEERPFALELALCQRYYEKGSYFAGAFAAAGAYAHVDYKVLKRVAPGAGATVVTGSTAYSGAGAGALALQVVNNGFIAVSAATVHLGLDYSSDAEY
jgi:hypothetical protein